MKGFARRLIDCKDYYCSISSEAKWLNSKKWAVGNLFFDYKRQITVTEQSGNDLTDYQVLIELNSTNFDFSHANSDGSDVRFHDGNNLLNYWIEKWNSVNQEAKIWVKVPSIPTNSSVSFHMYYGNPNAVSASNGEDTFEFFDDFEDNSINTSKWEDMGYGYESNGRLGVSSTPVHSNVIGLKIKNFTINFSIDKYAVEMRKVRKCNTTYYEDWAIVIRFFLDDNNYIDLSYGTEDEDNRKIFLVKKIGGTQTTIADTRQYIVDEDKDERFLINQGNIKEEYKNPTDSNWNEYGNFIYNVDGEHEILVHYKFDGLPSNSHALKQNFDLFFIHKYTDPEPSVGIGSEETP